MHRVNSQRCPQFLASSAGSGDSPLGAAPRRRNTHRTLIRMHHPHRGCPISRWRMKNSKAMCGPEPALQRILTGRHPEAPRLHQRGEGSPAYRTPRESQRIGERPRNSLRIRARIHACRKTPSTQPAFRRRPSTAQHASNPDPHAPSPPRVPHFSVAHEKF